MQNIINMSVKIKITSIHIKFISVYNELDNLSINIKEATICKTKLN